MLMKSQIILYIYDKLLEEKKLYSNEIIGEFGMSTRTFRRYISETQAFLTNFNKHKIIKYSMKDKCYLLLDEKI